MKLARLAGGPEIFLSIQGEGKSLGRPSVFVRTSQCNLHCQWCDTDYTWNFRGTPFKHRRDADPSYQKFDKAEQQIALTPAEVVPWVRKHACRNVVLTGGEPLIQQPALSELMRLLRDEDPGYRFEIETNGTFLPSAELDPLVAQYNVSPKLAHGGDPRSLRHNPEVLRHFAGDVRASFKFVVSGEADVDELLELVRSYAIEPERVYLMPEGTTNAALDQHAQAVLRLCLTHGFQYTDRLHVRLFGDLRGK